MTFMSIKPDIDTKKVQTYIKYKDIDIRGGQNHVLCYFIRNMGFRWAILHQSWVNIKFDGLKHNLKDSHVNKAWFWHQEVAKIHQMQENQSLKGSTLHFMLFLWKKYEI